MPNDFSLLQKYNPLVLTGDRKYYFHEFACNILQLHFILGFELELISYQYIVLCWLILPVCGFLEGLDKGTKDTDHELVFCPELLLHC